MGGKWDGIWPIVSMSSEFFTSNIHEINKLEKIDEIWEMRDERWLRWDERWDEREMNK